MHFEFVGRLGEIWIAWIIEDVEGFDSSSSWKNRKFQCFVQISLHVHFKKWRSKGNQFLLANLLARNQIPTHDHSKISKISKSIFFVHWFFSRFDCISSVSFLSSLFFCKKKKLLHCNKKAGSWIKWKSDISLEFIHNYYVFFSFFLHFTLLFSGSGTTFMQYIGMWMNF